MNPAIKQAARGRRRAQRGVTLFGLLFYAVLIAFAGYVVMRVTPTVTEYLAIKRAVSHIAASNPATVTEARQAFERQKEVEFGIRSLSGSDLEVTKVNDRVVIAFDYEKVVPVWGPVSLLIRYEGRSK
jgi:hypothetical protein